ncbi:putative ABC transporter permease protein [Microlunatus phosphovorus NM-1]|uniref:Putative ABC transporter permease protein n=1 Tax=Microlunatus phosphovorus (strain ATCC 700054 / DSM 10555 / JCM 9379 / NBRC 101784 / NCIMB 13414 / VKM Ac-1990 / NM-1) TaxID=1032480 RepID=F5XSI2_MICPN|nr:ABC transporter permease [Microlunatus phosphovorus]BAK34863.1 putative ABC transporter permease protein [Microlunatus phosphovorus NM-1]
MATLSERRERAPRLRFGILLFSVVYLMVPLIAAAVYGFSLPDVGFTLEPVRTATQDATFLPQLALSAQLAVLTTVGSLALLLPTLLWLHLKCPWMLPVTELLSVIPMVVPAVALVSGANLFFRATFPTFLVSPYSLVPFYVILTLPLVYRALDAGIRALDLRTMMDAGASLGAGWWYRLFTLVLPNMGSAVLTASLLCVTLGIGEFVLASLLLQNTFPVWLVSIGTSQARAAAALSFLMSIGTFLLLYLITAVSSRSPRSGDR